MAKFTRQMAQVVLLFLAMLAAVAPGHAYSAMSGTPRAWKLWPTASPSLKVFCVSRLNRSPDDVGGVLRHRPTDIGGAE